MKINIVILAMIFAVALASPFAFAQGKGAGGTPGAHGLSGAEFGTAGSELARSNPGAVGKHASDKHGRGGKGAPEVHPVSEPSTLLLLGTGLIGLFVITRRRKPARY
jgi:hypothetical protein